MGIGSRLHAAPQDAAVHPNLVHAGVIGITALLHIVAAIAPGETGSIAEHLRFIHMSPAMLHWDVQQAFVGQGPCTAATPPAAAAAVWSWRRMIS